MPDFPPRPGFGFPGPVPEQALRYLRGKGWQPAFSYLDVWREEHAQQFTVAKALSRDVLQAIRDALTQALAEGVPLRQFTKELTPTLQKLGWWGVQKVVDPHTGAAVEAQLGSPRRLKTLYDANLRTARAAGQWERIERTKASHPYLQYELGPSKDHRVEHAAWAERPTILPVDDAWWRTHMPPNGWGCKCRVRQLSQVEVDRRGLTVSDSPEVTTVEWTNRRTGEVLDVPTGIDPGWDYNPGQARWNPLTKRIEPLGGAGGA